MFFWWGQGPKLWVVQPTIQHCTKRHHMAPFGIVQCTHLQQVCDENSKTVLEISLEMKNGRETGFD